jgi:hypothetical protein
MVFFHLPYHRGAFHRPLEEGLLLLASQGEGLECTTETRGTEISEGSTAHQTDKNLDSNIEHAPK